MKRNLLRKLEQQHRSEQEEIRRKLLDHKREEQFQARLKQKADREEQKRIKAEQEKEFRERKALGAEEWKRLSREDQEKLRSQQLAEKQQRKEQQRLERKIRRRNFTLAVRSLKPSLIRKHFRENAGKWKLLLYVSFNSTVIFLLSYLVLFIIYQVVTVISASFFDYPVIVYYWEVYFNIGQESWYQDSVRTIFSSGPLFLFILGIISFIIYSNLKEMTGNFKLFFLWSYLHGINMLFGALLIGTLFETGVGHVISWMYVMDTGRMMYSTISIFILVVAGLVSIKSFLISGNAYFNEMTVENRGSFLRAQVFVPFLLGNLVLFMIRQPRFMFYETFTGLVMILILLPVLIGHRSYHDLFFDEDEKKPRIQWIAIVVLLVLILFYRGVLQFGLRIGG